MTDIRHYLQDGANHQAKAVLAFLENSVNCTDGIGIVGVARWENCREQGYVVSLQSNDYKKQLNIAFYEHRNSDNISALKWEQYGINSLTIETAKFGEIYKDKYDVSFEVSYGKVVEMAEWIIGELKEFWEENLIINLEIPK